MNKFWLLLTWLHGFFYCPLVFFIVVMKRDHMYLTADIESHSLEQLFGSFTVQIKNGSHRWSYATSSLKKTDKAWWKLLLKKKIFQIKYKAITLKTFSPLSYLKENPKARLSSIDKYFRKYGNNVYHPGM